MLSFEEFVELFTMADVEIKESAEKILKEVQPPTEPLDLLSHKVQTVQ